MATETETEIETETGTVAYIYKNGKKTREDAGASLGELKSVESCPGAFLFDRQAQMRHVKAEFKLVAGAEYDWVVPAPLAPINNQDLLRKSVEISFSDVLLSSCFGLPVHELHRHSDTTYFCSRFESPFLLSSSEERNVVLALDNSSGKNVAVKLLPSSDAKREAEILKQFHHKPHVIPLLEVIQLESIRRSALVFPYIGVKTISPEVVDRCLVQLVEAVACLHRDDVVHCDIKPSNVLFDGKELWLIDFGFATQENSHLVGCGPKPYSAPELSATWQAQKAMDVWSIGIVALEWVLETNLTEDSYSTLFQISVDPTSLTKLARTVGRNKFLTSTVLKLLPLMLHEHPTHRATINQLLKCIKWFP